MFMQKQIIKTLNLIFLKEYFYSRYICTYVIPKTSSSIVQSKVSKIYVPIQLSIFAFCFFKINSQNITIFWLNQIECVSVSLYIFLEGQVRQVCIFFCLPPYCPIIKRHRIYLFLFVYIVYMMCLYLLYTYLQFDRKLFSDRIHRGVFFFYISIHIYFSSICLTIRQFKEVSSSRTRILVFIFFSIEQKGIGIGRYSIYVYIFFYLYIDIKTLCSTYVLMILP